MTLQSFPAMCVSHRSPRIDCTYPHEPIGTVPNRVTNPTAHPVFYQLLVGAHERREQLAPVFGWYTRRHQHRVEKM